VSTASLEAAEAGLARLSESASDEGGKLRGLVAAAGSWTGRTATTLKSEMRRAGDQLMAAAPLLEDAARAVAVFRRTAEEARGTVADLNRRWSEEDAAYDLAVRSADTAYRTGLRETATVPAGTVSTHAEHRAVRDRAVAAAAEGRDAARGRLTGEFDALLAELRAAARACGAQLGAAVVAVVPAEVVSRYLAGSGRGPALVADFDGLTLATRLAVTGDRSLIAQADRLRRGQATADEVRRALDAGQPLSAEQVHALLGDADDPAFVHGLLSRLGPGGTALLAEAASRDAGRPRRYERLSSALAWVFSTGSGIQVDDGHGGQRPLLDAAWLDGFDPRADGGEAGYRPDLLVPFLTRPVSAGFAGLVAGRWLDEYETHGLLPSYPGTDPGLLPTVLDRVLDHPNLAAGLLSTRFETVAPWLTGQEPQLTGGDGDSDLIGDRLGRWLAQVALEQPDQVVADSVVTRLADYLVHAPGEHLIDPVLPAVGRVLADERYQPGLISSVTMPLLTGDGATSGGPRAPGRDPEFGLLLSADLWARLQQEALRSPDNVVPIGEALHRWVDESRDTTPTFARPEGATGESITPAIASVSNLEGETLRAFFTSNVQAVEGDLRRDLEATLERNGQDRAEVQRVIDGLIDVASNPTRFPASVTRDAVNWLVSGVGERADERARQRYEEEYERLTGDVDPGFTDPTVWTDLGDGLDNLAASLAHDPEAVAPLWVRPEPGADPEVFRGTPQAYITEVGAHVAADGTVTSADFLRYEAGEVVGVVPPEQMTHRQRLAFSRWLHDPVVQMSLSGPVDDILRRRGQQQPPREPPE
jgi:hypothetical protein